MNYYVVRATKDDRLVMVGPIASKRRAIAEAGAWNDEYPDRYPASVEHGYRAAADRVKVKGA